MEYADEESDGGLRKVNKNNLPCFPNIVSTKRALVCVLYTLFCAKYENDTRPNAARKLTVISIDKGQV